QVNNTSPLIILVALILIHIPFTPIILVKIKAIGILELVNNIETMGGIYVLPNPLNTPTVIYSIHIHICDIPIACIYPTPIFITSGSFIKSLTSSRRKIKNNNLVKLLQIIA